MLPGVLGAGAGSATGLDEVFSGSGASHLGSCGDGALGLSRGAGLRVGAILMEYFVLLRALGRLVR